LTDWDLTALSTQIRLYCILKSMMQQLKESFWN